MNAKQTVNPDEIDKMTKEDLYKYTGATREEFVNEMLTLIHELNEKAKKELGKHAKKKTVARKSATLRATVTKAALERRAAIRLKGEKKALFTFAKSTGTNAQFNQRPAQQTTTQIRPIETDADGIAAIGRSAFVAKTKNGTTKTTRRKLRRK